LSAVQPCGVAVMLSQHLLQKDDVRRGTADRFAQFVQNETSVEYRKALVYVDSQYLDRSRRPGPFTHALLHRIECRASCKFHTRLGDVRAPTTISVAQFSRMAV